MSDDAEELFNFRIDLIKSGANSHYIFWDDLAKQYPLRALHLLKLMCDEQLHIRLNSREKWSDYDTECVEKLAESHPQEVLSIFLPFLFQFFSSYKADEYSDYRWSHEYGTRTTLEEFIYKCLFRLIIKASKNTSLERDQLLQLLKSYEDNTNLIFNRIYANVLLNLDVQYADEVVEWLLDNPNQKFKLGNDNEEPIWKLTGKIIEKFSPYCSQKNFEQLESTIYFFPPDYDLNQIKRCLGYTRENCYMAYWGKTQYHLLPKLDRLRITTQSEQLIAVLNRKFEKYTEDSFCKRSNCVAGFVTSPLKSPLILSNKAWKKLITSDPSKFSEKKFRGDLKEASIHQFSNAFERAVISAPQRFAEFALTLPVDIPQDYINALYNGLRENDPSRVPDEFKEIWKPCSIELIEQVIDNFASTEYSRALESLLSAKVKILSPQYVTLLEDIAKSSFDPLPGKLNIYTVGHADQLDEISSRDLRSNTINCTRGSAYTGLASKFWDDQEYALSHKYLIENALNDGHAAVRMATADLLLPMYNYDKGYAFEMFIELCQKDIRNTLSDGYHYYFNNAFTGQYRESFVSLVKTMLESKYEDVRKEGHKQVVARWLFNDLFEAELQLGLESKNIESVLGYASVINQLLGNDTKGYDHSSLKAIFEILVNSENEDILKKMGRFFNQRFWSKRYAREFFEIYVQSKALNHNIYNILHSIEESSIGMAQFSDLIIIMTQNILKLKTQELMNNLDTNAITRVIQQLYDQAENDQDDETLSYCLDMWDELLASNYSFIRNMTEKLDGGLLA